MVFAKLKENGTPVEFVSEQARMYIAEKRVEWDMLPEAELKLGYQDQVAIMGRQVTAEQTFAKACGPQVVVVSDSSPLNALLYMTPAERKSFSVQRMLQAYLKHIDLAFYAPPIGVSSARIDPNRVHTLSQSLQIDAIIPAVLAKNAPALQVIPVFGDAETRYSQVVAAIYSKQVSG